jgi:O-antigen/teichoic acid export membrane protein
MVLSLVNSVLLSRWLGPSGRGEVAASMLWPVLLVYIGSLGLMSSVLYFAALDESKVETIFSNSVVLAVAQSLLILPVGFAILPWLLSSQNAEVIKVSRLFLLFIPISLLTQYGNCILQGRMRISAFNWLRSIIPFGYLAGVIFLEATGRLGLLEIILLHLFLNVITLVATFAFLLTSVTRLRLQVDTSLARQMLKYGAQVQIGDVSQAANLRLDQALMAGLLPPFELGLYVVAVSSASLLQVVSGAVRTVITPSIAQEVSTEGKAAILYRVFRKYLLLSLIAISVIGITLPLAIPIVFGADFKGALWPSEVLLLGAFFVGAKDVLTGAVQALGKPWLGSRAELVSLIITVALLAILMPTMGILGAAIATTVSYATQLGVVVHGLHRSFDISPASLFHVRLSDLKTIFLMPMLSRARTAGLDRIQDYPKSETTEAS